MLKKCYLRDFNKQPNQNSIDIPMQTSKALFVTNSKLSINAHLVWICPKDRRGRYVLFFKITSLSEIKRNDNVCDHSCVARKDSRIIWSAIVVHQVMNYTLSHLHFENVKSSKIQFRFISLYFNAMQVIAWSKSLVLHLLLSYFDD